MMAEVQLKENDMVLDKEDRISILAFIVLLGILYIIIDFKW